MTYDIPLDVITSALLLMDMQEEEEDSYQFSMTWYRVPSTAGYALSFLKNVLKI